MPCIQHRAFDTCNDTMVPAAVAELGLVLSRMFGSISTPEMDFISTEVHTQRMDKRRILRPEGKVASMNQGDCNLQ